MNVWSNLQQVTTTSVQSGDRPAPMYRSRAVEVDGIFLGVAVEHELGVGSSP